MARKKKGELPSGNIRRQVYIGSELVFDEAGTPVIDPKTGKQKKKRLYSSITASTSDQADYQKSLVKLQKQSMRKPLDMTLRDAINLYIENSDKVLSPSTIRGYDIIRRYAFQDILDMKLSDIDNAVLRSAVNREAKRSPSHFNDKSKTISPKTVANEYGLITAVLNQYTDIDCTVKLPQRERKIKELPEPEEVFRAIKGSCVELPVLLAMWLSFSMSEVRGLTKSKSIHGNYITITEVSLRLDKNDVIKKQAKKETRNRKHRIPDYLMNLIEQVDTDVLVPHLPHWINYHFQKCIKDAGLPHMTFHDLRHMNASIMSVLNIPEKYAMERGGWSSDNVMKNVYTHTFSEARNAVDNQIDEYFYTNVIKAAQIPPQDTEKYKSWLVLFDRTDSEKSRQDFADFMKMQHGCNTKK